MSRADSSLVADLAADRERWALHGRLEDADPDADLAGSFAWCRASVRAVGEERIVHVALHDSGGASVGLVVLEHGKTGWRSGSPGRACLRWPFQELGYGFGPRWEPGVAPEVRAGWLTALRSRFPDVHFELERCSAEAFGPRSADSHGSTRMAEGDATWTRAVEGSVDEYLASLKGKHRRDLAKYRRDIAAAGGEWIECSGAPVELARAFEACFELHRRRLSEKHTQSAYFSERGRRFLLALAREMGPEGLRLTLLRCGGRDVAGCLSYVFRHRYKAFLSGWDRSHARLDLGRQVIYHQILGEFERGVREIDLLGGDLDYKREFGLVRRPTLDVIGRPNPSAQRREALVGRALELYRGSRRWMRSDVRRRVSA